MRPATRIALFASFSIPRRPSLNWQTPRTATHAHLIYILPAIRTFSASSSQRSFWNVFSKPTPPLADVNRPVSEQVFQELGQDEIRLVKLHSAPTREADIVCSLQTALLQADGPQEFEALSYVWGSAEKPKTITLEEHPYAITSNLDEVLRELRTDGQPRYLWIDALAINQSFIPERNNQVRLMPRIYSSAKQTVVWLGPLGGDTIPIFTFAKVVRVLDIADIFKNLGKDQLMNSGYRFANLPYWTRAWVVQETARSQSVIFQSGQDLMTFDEFSKVWKALQDIASQTHEAFVDNAGTVAQMLVQSKINSMPLDLLEPGIREDNQKLDYVGWVNDFALRRQCQDPRDKVFAAFMLLPESVREQITINYELRTEDVFADLTQAFMKSAGAFRILEMVDRLGHAPEYSEDTPSWVPDYLKNGPGREPALQRYPFNELSVYPNTPELQDRVRGLGTFFIEDKSRILQLSGYKIGTVSKASATKFVLPEMPHGVDYRDVVINSIDSVRAHYKQCFADLEINKEESRSFTYTFVGPLLKTDEATPHFEILFGYGHEHGITAKELFDEDIPVESLDQFQSFMNVHGRRVMFRFDPTEDFSSAIPAASREASFGIAADGLRVGDEVFVCPGSMDPFVLRPYFHGSYRFIGSAFVGSLRDPAWLWDRIEGQSVDMEAVSIV